MTKLKPFEEGQNCVQFFCDVHMCITQMFKVCFLMYTCVPLRGVRVKKIFTECLIVFAQLSWEDTQTVGCPHMQGVPRWPPGELNGTAV